MADPGADPGAEAAVETVLSGQARDLGDGFVVARILPQLARRSVGPFVFFDRFGPVDFPPGRGTDVRPHPHIGLSTLTYLIEGEILHRDSLGSVQPIRPGAVNWMTAGRGIVHSERTPPAARAAGARLLGAQMWVALPQAEEETTPSFVHHPAADLPLIAGDGTTLRLVAGTLAGARSPVPVLSPLFFADATLAAGARLALPAEHAERAVFPLSGDLTIGGAAAENGRLHVLGAGGSLAVAARRDARVLMFGGAPLDGPRHMWWNFVSSRRERIEQAKADWKAGRFAPVPGESESIPLPD
jgi:redox-sensitive bicupin YhaK (pirin superfamily)